MVRFVLQSVTCHTYLAPVRNQLLSYANLNLLAGDIRGEGLCFNLEPVLLTLLQVETGIDLAPILIYKLVTLNGKVHASILDLSYLLCSS